MKHKQRRWVIFNNGSIHGIQHSELTIIRRAPSRCTILDSVAVFTISRWFGLIAALTLATALALLLTGCQTGRPQKGGAAAVTISRPGHTNAVTLSQSDNPKEPSRQVVQSEQSIEYVLPPGTAVGVGDGSWKMEVGEEAGGWRTDAGGQRSGVGGRWSELTGQRSEGVGHHSQTPQPSNSQTPPRSDSQTAAILTQPMPVKCVLKDRTETMIGGAQKDSLREWAGRAANMQPVMWAGIVMMTLVAGALVYFGWWTKAAIAVGVGLGMVIVAQTLPDHGTMVLLAGLGLFALLALLVLYTYYKGQLDRNQNGIPDFLETKGS
jgi:hypothetical protein